MMTYSSNGMRLNVIKTLALSGAETWTLTKDQRKIEVLEIAYGFGKKC